MGQYSAMQAVFNLHALGHANAWAAVGQPVMAGPAEMLRSDTAKGLPGRED